ncbi:hypothetical protein UA32_08650 [Photobacterium angustum]|uniref:InvasinE Adhesion domain-containing protein n=1 Tax=Photobacterium angustum TaxID=661 RepID=A0ABX5H4T6_PHOAN|nr:DUF823 domain-containing adhesin [Photobacterium angustum]KJG38504.1 hypothetical protein UA32_08650 [Photobacterium angustum]PSX10817.1 hypothetical protein C0W27_09245 [Photobacterium angustum]
MLLQKIKNKIKIPISITLIFIIVTSTLTACGGGNDSNTDPVKKQLKKITIERTFKEQDGLNANEALTNITFELKAIGHYSDGSSDNITASTQWISSDPTIANFKNASLLHTNKIGKINVTAQVNNITAVWPLSILEPVAITITPSLKSADFDNTQMTFVPRGTSITLDTIVEWSDNSKRDGANFVSWMLNDTSFAQDFTQSNRFRAVGNYGEITSLTASFQGVSSDAISLEVSDETLQKIIINSTPSSKNTPLISGVLYGTSRTFTAIGIYQETNNNQVTHAINITKDVEWTSSAPSIFDNIDNSNVFTAYSGVVNSKALISAKMFDVESNKQELTIADAALSQINIIGPNQSGNLINGVETTLSAIGHYHPEADSSKDITADLTPFVTWSSSNEEILKQVDNNTFLPSANFGKAWITAQIKDTTYKSVKEFSISPGKLENITIFEIHNYPEPNAIPLNQTRTYKAMGIYSIDNSGETISLDITKHVYWQLDQTNLNNPFIQEENRNTIKAIGLTDTPSKLTAKGLTLNDVQSNTLELTSFRFKKEFTMGKLKFSLSPLMMDRYNTELIDENGNIWGTGKWETANTSCQKMGKELATEEQLITLVKTIGSPTLGYGWPALRANYWTSTTTDNINQHISKNLFVGGGSYEEDDTTYNYSVCVTNAS